MIHEHLKTAERWRNLKKVDDMEATGKASGL